MILTKELIYEKISQNCFATMVTYGENRINSRTMHYGFSPGKGIYILTQKNTDKLNDIVGNPQGLFHIAKIEEDIKSSYDISIWGRFERCAASSPDYLNGIKTLSKSNPQILNLADSEAKLDYELMIFRIDEIQGYSYLQSINGLPKTIIKE
ncbi:MAG: hypothetical protein ACM3YE_10925 [Bacteroidota bacterium]